MSYKAKVDLIQEREKLASLSEFLRTQANELWLPILALEDVKEDEPDMTMKIRLRNAITDLYKMQSSLEIKAQEIENA